MERLGLVTAFGILNIVFAVFRGIRENHSATPRSSRRAEGTLARLCDGEEVECLL